jgi:hypothetical protein
MPEAPHSCHDCTVPCDEPNSFCARCAPEYPPRGWRPGDPVNDNRKPEPRWPGDEIAGDGC